MRTSLPLRPSILLLLPFCVLLGSGSVLATATPLEGRSVDPDACEDFAQRQVSLADQLLRKSSFNRALKVLNSTAENCDRPFVRKKIVEVLNEWYGRVRRSGSTSNLDQFLEVLSNQPYVNAAQRSQFVGRIESYVESLIQNAFSGQNMRTADRLCRAYSGFVRENFASEYYCGRAALAVGAPERAMSSYQWLVDNWPDDPSLTSWEEITEGLEDLYFVHGRFREAYELARAQAVRNPSPDAILSSLVSARGNFLSPILHVGTIFYREAPSQSALSHVGAEMQQVKFPDYVSALYLLSPDGTVERGMYGSEANEPTSTHLENVQGQISLLQPSEPSNMAWLVSPVGSNFLVLEFGVGTSAEESVRLESVYDNIETGEEWEKLYDLEFRTTAPAAGSAVATLLTGARLGNQNLRSYDAVFDDSSLLTYYCIQNRSGDIQTSYNFDRTKLEYGEEEWQRTSNTPALYHHSIQYDAVVTREVIWPQFVDDTWRGVVRVGLAQS